LTRRAHGATVILHFFAPCQRALCTFSFESLRMIPFKMVRFLQAIAKSQDL
jgi:hypothetical protein